MTATLSATRAPSTDEAFSGQGAALGRRHGTGINIQVIDNDHAFAQLRGTWTELLRASDSDNPFLTWEWLHAWWSHLRGSSELRLLEVRSGGKTIAIAPFRVAPSARCWRRIEFLGTGHAGSDYLDVIVRRGCDQLALTALAQYLNAHRLAIRLDRLATGSFGRRLAAAVDSDAWTSAAADDGTCPVIPLAGHTFESYLSTLGSSHRANVRRRLRAIEQQFTMRFEPVTGDRERCDMLALLAAWHEQRFQQDGTAFCTPEVRAFQDEATRRAMASGWLRMYALRLDDVTAAVMYGFSHGGRFYFYQHGYDERYAPHSVGLVLMALTIRAAIEEGLGEFDMLWGVEPYKFLWAREARALQRIELYPVDLGGILHRRALAVRRGAGRLARRVMSIGESLGS